jgi:hypothetical protein
MGLKPPYVDTLVLKTEKNVCYGGGQSYWFWCCFGKMKTVAAHGTKVRSGPEVTGLVNSTRGAVCRHSLRLQTKWARPKKADAQGHDPVFSGSICSEGRQ